MRFFGSGFLNESPSHKPLKIKLGAFRIFSKICGDIGKSRCTTGVNDTGGKFAAGVNDTGGKLPPVSTTPAANFSTSSPCVVDTGGKFATGVNDTGGNRCQRRRWRIATGNNDTGGKFAAGIVDTGGK